MQAVSERRAPRFATDATLVVSNNSATGEPFETTGRCVNVSRGGLCSELVTGVDSGASYELQMSLVFDEDVQSEPLSLRARAVWCTQIGEVWQVGFQFLPLEPAQMSYLQMFLRYLGGGATGSH